MSIQKLNTPDSAGETLLTALIQFAAVCGCGALIVATMCVILAMAENL